MERVTFCQACGAQNVKGHERCAGCGAPLERTRYAAPALRRSRITPLAVLCTVAAVAALAAIVVVVAS